MSPHGGAEAHASCICFPASPWGLILDFSHSWAADKEVPFTENRVEMQVIRFFFLLSFLFLCGMVDPEPAGSLEVPDFPKCAFFFVSNYIQRQGNHRFAFVGGSEFPKYLHFIHHFHSHSIVPEHVASSLEATLPAQH